MDGRTGTVASVNVSPGGVPKLPVDRAYVSEQGMEGDRQADLRHHGGPLQTLCLFSLEVIEQLRAEGHPIAAGSAGENLTLSGVDWSLLGQGVRLRIGDTLVAEVTVPATPCSKNAQWFSDRRFSRIDHDTPARAVGTPGSWNQGLSPRVTEPLSSPDRNSAPDVPNKCPTPLLVGTVHPETELLEGWRRSLW